MTHINTECIQYAYIHTQMKRKFLISQNALPVSRQTSVRYFETEDEKCLYPSRSQAARGEVELHKILCLANKRKTCIYFEVFFQRSVSKY